MQRAHVVYAKWKDKAVIMEPATFELCGIK